MRAPRRRGGIGRSTFFATIAVVAVVSFVLGTRQYEVYNLVAPMFGQKTVQGQLDMRSVQDTYRTLARNYDGTLDTAKLIDGASRGMVAAAGDQYTVFMSAEEAAEFGDQLDGKVSGIGAEIGVRDDQPTILRLLDNSPAARAGLMPLDRIVGVDDRSTEGYDAARTADLIRGEEGTTVKVSVLRQQEPHSFTITRAQVSDPSVASEINDGIGIMKIRRFDEQTNDLARRAAEQFRSANVRGVILDLRDNGGGYLEQAQQVSGIWLDNKLVVTERRGDKETDRLNSQGAPILGDIKTVVLVNGGSASASEIVAGALKDHGVAPLIGEKTFGKGTVQQVINLADGRQLKVTIARWFTPNGVNLSKNGIQPDTKVELNAKDMNEGRDPQLDAAKAAL